MVEKNDHIDPEDRDEDEIEGEGSDTERDDGESGVNDEAKEREAQARAMGWVPEDEWDDDRAEKAGKRKPKVFKTADEFLQAAEDNPAMERERNRHATRMLVDLNKKLDEATGRLKDMGKVFDDQRRMNREAQKRAYEKGLAEAQALRKEAIADGDVEKADQAQEKIDEIKADQAKLKEEPESEDDREEPAARRERKGVDPRLKEWEDANPWFLKDPALNSYMRKVHSQLMDKNPGVSQADLLDDAADLVKRRFPEEFSRKENPRRQGAAAVNGSTGNRKDPPGKSGKRWEDVPAEDRATYERHKKMIESTRPGTKYTREEFMADYFSQ